MFGINIKLLLFFCAATVSILASTDQIEPEKNIFCVHGKWAHFRNGSGHFGIAEINPFLCTHLIYTFFGIDSEANIVINDPWLDLSENYGLGNLRKLINLKEINPKLKILPAIGGWFQGSKAFSLIANSGDKRKIFVKNCLDFVKKYNFDGLYLDWQHPGHREGSRPSDKEAFTLLLKDLAKSLHFRGLLLTALVAPEEFTADVAYDVHEISKYLDFVMLKTFDMHGFWGPKIGSNSPLYPKASEQNSERVQNVDSGVFYWLEKGTPSEKLIIGIPTYGRGFKMISGEKSTTGSPHEGPSDAGPYTNDPGILGYNELCEKRLIEDWEDFWDDEQLVPYSTKGNQWIGYDNEESVRIKGRYVRSFKLGGVMVGNIETDDFKGFCGKGNFPLLKEINEALKEIKNEPPEPEKVCEGS